MGHGELTEVFRTLASSSMPAVGRSGLRVEMQSPHSGAEGGGGVHSRRDSSLSISSNISSSDSADPRNALAMQHPLHLTSAVHT
jgi:hypothetical protein